MVSTYGIPEGLGLDRVSKSNYGSPYYEVVIGISIIIPLGDIVSYNSVGGDKTLYDEWCQKHGDMSYNRKEEYKIGDTPPHEFVAADYTAIEIVSDTDWDTEHPAGTSLADIAMFYSASPIRYIQSGYSREYDWSDTPMPGYVYKHMQNWTHLRLRDGIYKGKTPFYPVKKLASELKPEDMVLLGSGDLMYGSRGGRTPIGFLEFTTRPTKNKTHNITVTLTTDEGEVFSDTIQMVFE